MFLALRELRYARGRFGLMGAVVALIAILVVTLSGLSSGLVNDGVSGLKSMPVSAFAFDEGTKTDNAFSRSVVDAEQLAAWQQVDGVADAEPVGAGMVNASLGDGTQIDLSLFGIEPGSALAPELSEGENFSSLSGVVLSETARDEGVGLGDIITLDRVDTELRVVGFTEGQTTFGHVDMAFLHLDTWRLIAAGAAQPGSPTQEQVDALASELASVIAIHAEPGGELDLAAGDASAHTSSVPLEESFNSSPGYEAETLTLSMIQVFLYAICALVVGAFFTVWTIQRQHELAVLRAIGASGRYLLRDSLVQAAILLVAFTGIGVAAGVGLGAAMPAGMPFALEAGPVIIATATTIVLGLLGAAVAVLRIIRVDPLTALGGQR
ncbi:ABC transporter permease [Leucobacter massiliensis]|uniref:ABC transporter permease n=1 Tax=Leucobacter massiliensis TaxID=1686285 RepID=A0A2S9QRB5_9MICO|nr:ABC transporter permease [Leucobacter massiliensis]PRI12133.1 ABC transporter permease [Leucobacter massiliensis]